MERKIKNLVSKIVDEHHDICENGDAGNMHYLWWMYRNGVKKGTYKPFMFFAELQLLNYLDIVKEEQIESMIKLLESPDKENTFVAALAINTFRKERIKRLGEFHPQNESYKNVVKDYEHKILNANIFKNFKSKIA
jgi:hypothetical protein